METPLSRVDPNLIDTAAKTRQANQTARLLKSATARMVRGERVPTATVNAVGKFFPTEAQELHDLLPLVQAQQGTMGRTAAPDLSQRVQQLGQQADALINTTSGQAGRAFGERTFALERARQPLAGEGTIANKLAPVELIREIDKWVDVPGLHGRPREIGEGAVQEVFKLMRSTLVSMDLSAGFVQGQALFFRNNPAWWRAQRAGVAALIKEPLSYVEKNISTIDEGVRMGAIVPPSEYLFSAQGLSSLPAKVPGFRQANRAFEWFTFVGQHELYKAARGNAQSQAELVSVSSAIRKIMGTESSALSGVTRRQQAVEAWLAFAPRFYRATHGMVAQAFTPGPGGNEARKALGAMLAGGTAITIGAHYASTGTLPNFDRPEREDWAKFKFRGSYVSAFGPFHNLFRTLARAGVYTAQGEPGRAATEVRRYATSKASIPVRSALSLADLYAKGYTTTFEGEKITASPGGALTWLKEQAPIGPAGAVESVVEGHPEGVLGVTGLNIRPLSQLNEVAREIYPTSRSTPEVWYEDLEPYQKAKVKDAIMGNRKRWSQYNEAVDQLYLEKKANWERRAKSAEVQRAQGWKIKGNQQAKNDRGAILDDWAEDNAELSDRKSQTAKLLLGEAEYPDVMAGFTWQDLAGPASYPKVVERLKAEKAKDPLQGALSEYYFAYELARHSRSVDGTTMWDDTDARGRVTEGALTWARNFVANGGVTGEPWTPEQREYVLRNTHLNRPPQEILNLMSDKTKREYAESEAARQRRPQRRAP